MAPAVDDLLTTKQLQDLLQVDRITIYRMLNDGRLRGFKVGGQWRFSRHEIEAWLQEQQSGLDISSTSPPPGGGIAPSSQTLPLSCVQAIQDVCAEALDIAAVTIDLDGTLLTEVANSCDFCNLILASHEGQRRCTASWKQTDRGRVHRCHAGLMCVSAPIEVGGHQVAITAGCQFATQPPDAATLAAQLGLVEGDLLSAASSVRLVPESYLPQVSRLIQRVADTFSEIGQERLNLLSRLQHIAEISTI
jgi:excisionase family DNA binding protein